MTLFSLSPLDGRSRESVEELSQYFSEFALFHYRVKVEVEYLIFLSSHTELLRVFSKTEISTLHELYEKFSTDDAIRIKEIEETTKHDVKAVEYFLQEKLNDTSMNDCISFLHFGITSYDINTPAYALMLSDARWEILIPELDKALKVLKSLITETRSMTMLARTHGQPALPTTMGKELVVFYERIQKEKKVFETIEIEAKLTGAVGNFNALSFVYPDLDWISLSNQFILSLGLIPNVITTQILPYDSWLKYFDSLKRLNNILVNFTQDIWWYISFEYFLQKKKEGEVGSSTMSHKINPIQFENAEGNLQLANSLFEFFTRKLAVSRLQRDLSDSTVTRNFGVAIGHTLIALKSIQSGLKRIVPNKKKMEDELDSHWEIYAEGIQTYLRMRGNTDAYELLKEKTQGRTLLKEEMYQIIDALPLKSDEKKKLKITSLSAYVGLAEKIVDQCIEI
jgi:adenylosuccinate lyase